MARLESHVNNALYVQLLRALLSLVGRRVLRGGDTREKQAAGREALSESIHLLLVSLEPLLVDLFACELQLLPGGEAASSRLPGHEAFVCELAALLLDCVELTSGATRTFCVPLDVQLSAEGLLLALLRCRRAELRLVALHFVRRTLHALEVVKDEPRPLAVEAALSRAVLCALLDALCSEEPQHPESVALAAECLCEAAPLVGLSRLLQSAERSDVPAVRSLLLRTLQRFVGGQTDVTTRETCAAVRWSAHIFLQYSALLLCERQTEPEEGVCCQLLDAIDQLRQSDAVAQRLAAADAHISLLSLALAALLSDEDFARHEQFSPLFRRCDTPGIVSQSHH